MTCDPSTNPAAIPPPSQPRPTSTLYAVAMTLVVAPLVFSPILGVVAFLMINAPKDARALLQEQLASASAEMGVTIDIEAYNRGREAYLSSCIACHGENGEAKPGLGKAIAGSEFIREIDDKGLVTFLKKGRDPSDPLNTTGIGMPPKGGNPALTDKHLEDLVAYMRGLQTKQ